MAITSVKLIEDTPTKNEDRIREYTQVYRIEADEALTSTQAWRKGSSSYPEINDAHRDDLEATVTNIDVDREDNAVKPWIFYLTAQYSTETEKQKTEDPIQDSNEVNWSSTEAEEKYFIDVKGNYAVNSANQVFNSLPKRKVANWEVSITVRQSNFNISSAESIINTVNSNTFYFDDGVTSWGLTSGTGFLTSIAPSKVKYKNGIPFYEVKYVIKLNPKGWNKDADVIDRGTKRLNKDSEQVPILDASGTPVSEDVKLDGYGGLARGGRAGKIKLQPYNTANWSFG